MERNEIQLPHTTPSAEGAPRARRRSWLPDDLNLGGFVRRITRALDFFSGEDRPLEVRLEDLREWCREAADKHGKIAALVAIAKVADAYALLDDPWRDAFFAMLRDEFSVDESEVLAAGAAFAVAGDGQGGGPGVARSEALVRLSRALESPRLALFEQFNTIPSGMKFLVDLRADLRERLARDPSFGPLEYELQRKLASFFNLGFLRLERITWESPAALLENLIAYESVNRIHHWDDLKHRLISDRACYAFLHPAMPNEPVIFVEVALVKGLASNIQHLLDPEAPDLRPEQADTAIFYGISNAQKGLRGIQFGNLLIKKVVTRLHQEVPNVETFATLSPLPRFRRDFLEAALADGSVAGYFEKDEGARLRFVAQAPDVAAAARELLAEPEWHRNADAAEALRPGLLRAARAYLSEHRRDGRAACPVAHFHGSNGALLARLNWLGDTSAQGIAQSAGIMANYLYDLVRFEKHQSDYLRAGQLTLGKEVKGL
jgi:malonyl-CoA decarboxylase